MLCPICTNNEDEKNAFSSLGIGGRQTRLLSYPNSCSQVSDSASKDRPPAYFVACLDLLCVPETLTFARTVPCRSSLSERVGLANGSGLSAGGGEKASRRQLRLSKYLTLVGNPCLCADERAYITSALVYLPSGLFKPTDSRRSLLSTRAIDGSG